MEERYARIFGQLNPETQSHSRRVAHLCKFLAPVVGVDEDLAYRLGYVHDFGKLYVPSRILKKSEKLTAIEREVVDLHSYFGYKLLKEEMKDSAEIYIPVLFHHGFLKPRMCLESSTNITNEMMKSISVLHSADVYDAMTNKRVYHNPFSVEETLTSLEGDALCNREIIDALSEYVVYRKVSG